MLITKTPPPKIANPAAIEPNVSVNGLDLAVIFSCLKFSSLARRIFDSELPLDQKMHLRYFVEKIDRICDQAEDIADEVQIYAIKRSV